MTASSILAGGSLLAAIVQITMMFARIVIGIGLACVTLERGRGDKLRALAFALLAGGVAAALLGASGIAGAIFSPASAILQMASFTLTLVICTKVVQAYFGCSIWAAIFCTTFGYTIQNLASATSELFASVAMALVPAPNFGAYLAVTLAPALVTYPVAYLVIVCSIGKGGLLSIEDRKMALMLPIVSLAIIGFDLAIKALEATGVTLGFIVIFRLVHGAACVFVLWLAYELLYRRQLELERATTARLLAEHERQFRQSEQSIEAINIKCHDIRHQIRSLGGAGTVDPAALDDIAREVSIYDSAVKTGNTALDTILTEKSLLCERQHITLTCIADGSALDFMAAADLYALFGNALDNAIEAVSELDDPALRSITLVVKQVMGTASIHVENYFAGTRTFEGGLPQTTKDDRFSHGFGTRSMRQIAERYDGTVTMTAKDDRFILDALIPLSPNGQVPREEERTMHSIIF